MTLEHLCGGNLAGSSISFINQGGRPAAHLTEYQFGWAWLKIFFASRLTWLCRW
jgi:hypothetical protein